MAKLTLFALMAATLAIIRACTISPLDTDPGGHVSYDGTVTTLEIRSNNKSEPAFEQERFIIIKDCVRASIVRDENHLEISILSCNGTSFGYERELAEALDQLERSRFEISPTEQGLVKFTQCLSTGLSISLYLVVERQCSTTEACRVVARGRKELAIRQYGLMRSFDVRNLLPNGDNAGCLIGGQASAMIMGHLMYVFQVVIHS